MVPRLPWHTSRASLWQLLDGELAVHLPPVGGVDRVDHPGPASVTYTVPLQFTLDGSTITGEWTHGPTARGRWDKWVGLYATADSEVTVRIVEASPDGARPVLARENGQASGPV
jgi:hypothetical protein